MPSRCGVGAGKRVGDAAKPQRLLGGLPLRVLSPSDLMAPRQVAGMTPRGDDGWQAPSVTVTGILGSLSEGGHQVTTAVRPRFRPGSPRQRPHSLIGKAGAVPRLFAPRNVWTGTLGAAQNAVIFTTGPSEIMPGEWSSVCVEVQLRLGSVRSPNDPVLGRRSVQFRLVRRLTFFGRTNLLFQLWTLRVGSDRSKGKVTRAFSASLPCRPDGSAASLPCGQDPNGFTPFWIAALAWPGRWR